MLTGGFLMNQRLLRLREVMDEFALDAVVLNSITAIRYFSAFTSDESYVIITGKRAVLITDFRYTIQAKEQSGADFEIIESSGADQLRQVESILKDGKCSTLGFEEDCVTCSRYQDYTGIGVRLVPFADKLHSIRIIKTADEIRSLQKAQDLADQAFTALLKVIHSGMTERQVAAELDYIGAKLGSEGPSFDTIVGSGPNGAMCHAVPGERRLSKGDLVVLDYGCIYNGYHSDMTRTFAVGEVDDFSKKIYGIVLDAQLKALDSLKPGITGKELDSISRGFITEHGYGNCFGHSLGHGFGLLIHEAPRAAQSCDTVFREGMTITVEPGIYIEGRLGVRIEDCCVVTEGGKLNFCHSTKKLQYID